MPDKTEITLAQILRYGALSDNVGAFIDFTDHTGQEHQLKFGLDMAQNLIAAISQAEPKVIREQVKETGAESTQAHSRKVINYEFVLDLAKQAALVIFRFVDQTTVSVQIPRSDLKVAIESLTNILRRLEISEPLTRH